MSEVTKSVVVPFDVDDTLVHTGGAGAKSWMAAFERLHGIPVDIGEHTSGPLTLRMVRMSTPSSGRANGAPGKRSFL